MKLISLYFGLFILFYSVSQSMANDINDYIRSIIDLIQNFPNADCDDHNRVERMERIWEEHCKVFTAILLIVQATQVTTFLLYNNLIPIYNITS